VLRAEYANAFAKSMPDIVEITDEVFHVKHSNLFFPTPQGADPTLCARCFT